METSINKDGRKMGTNCSGLEADNGGRSVRVREAVRRVSN